VFYHTKLAHITYVTFPWLIAMPALTDYISDSNRKWTLPQNVLY